MLTTSRRTFLRNSVIAAAGIPLLGCGTDANKTTTSKTTEAMSEATLPYLDTIGIQLWTVRDQMAEDPQGTLATLKELGYYQVEFGDTQLLKELKPVCDDLGLKVCSSFINWKTVTGGWQYTPEDTPFEFTEVLDQAGEAGLSHLVFGYFRPEERTNGDDWRKLADNLNEAGLRAKQNGLLLTYHNHNFEWDPIEDTTGFDLLLDRMDGDLVPFELDLFWAQIAGQDARKTMELISDRVELLHLKQLHPGTPVVTRLADVPENAYEELPDGDMPIKDLMHLGKKLGVAYCMIEQDGNYDTGSLASAEKSLAFLQG
jgi:sugar phosphate isomerase/epimerase